MAVSRFAGRTHKNRVLALRFKIERRCRAVAHGRRDARRSAAQCGCSIATTGESRAEPIVNRPPPMVICWSFALWRGVKTAI